VVWEPIYTASKHAVLGISDGLRAELAAVEAPVGVSVVMPGMIKTGMNPVGSIPAEQVAANVVDAMRRGRPYVFTDMLRRAGLDEVIAFIEKVGGLQPAAAAE